MSDIIILFDNLDKCTLEEYEAIKPVLLAVSADTPHLVELLEKLFALVESGRPKLLEQKGGAA